MAKTKPTKKLLKKGKVQIFTRDYRPFILGGDVHQPMACVVEANGPYPLGKGFQGYLIVSPAGKTYVAEATTGALVGPSLEEVRADIKSAQKAVMLDQVKRAKTQAEDARVTNEKEFWDRLENRAGI